ncbi:hypothetical protein CFAM422_002157 [Trichoderma lentiforme]|uniref:Uncharacterized protein n=1 Tax=Trichoderma lentiforme TaxID=1567552 RepID=A0A9P4XNS5_9HYPO|nr:hypothetical protein CFAM422_002157 [Trichoderma lentiforme]
MVAARQDSTLDFPLRSSTTLTLLWPNARVIRHVDTRGDAASWKHRIARVKAWLSISNHPMARQPDPELSTPAVAYCSVIGYEVRGARDARSHQALKFMRALVFGLDLRGHRSWTLDSIGDHRFANYCYLNACEGAPFAFRRVYAGSSRSM